MKALHLLLKIFILLADGSMRYSMLDERLIAGDCSSLTSKCCACRMAYWGFDRRMAVQPFLLTPRRSQSVDSRVAYLDEASKRRWAQRGISHLDLYFSFFAPTSALVPLLALI